MKILAVDTTFGACSVAIRAGETCLSRRIERMDRGHAEALAPMVEEAIDESGLVFTELDRLGVTTGPGTFTGQRVGLAFMRGLRVALKKPLVGITTLEAMCAAAMNEAGTDFAAAVHDAKRGEAYLGIAGKHGVLRPKLVALENAADEIEMMTKQARVALAGTAAETVAAKLS